MTTYDALMKKVADLEAMGFVAEGRVYREQAEVLSNETSKKASVSESSDYTITLRDVDMKAFHEGWGQQNRRPEEPCTVDGVTDGWVEPANTSRPQIWLYFNSTDGNDYRDFIVISYTGRAAGKLRDILDAIGIPFDTSNESGYDILSWDFPPGLACKLQFLGGQGENRDQVRLANILPPTYETTF
mgnify:CR=1 FL=1